MSKRDPGFYWVRPLGLDWEPAKWIVDDLAWGSTWLWRGAARWSESQMGEIGPRIDPPPA